MSKCILFCEGFNDCIFFAEYLKQRLSLNTIITNPAGAQRLHQSCKDVLIANCGGSPAVYRAPNRLMRQLLGMQSDAFLIIVADSDRTTFQDVEKDLKAYTHTPCKTHNLHPLVKIKENGLSLLEPRFDLEIKSKFFSVPKNLETQLANKLKLKYKKLKTYTNSDYILEKVKNEQYNGDDEHFIRECVRLFTNEKWLTSIYAQLKDIL